jgi:hypothetical protein
MDVQLLMRVGRDTDGRLTGVTIPSGGLTSYGFSCTLEMHKVLEDLVLTGDDGERGDS